MCVSSGIQFSEACGSTGCEGLMGCGSTGYAGLVSMQVTAFSEFYVLSDQKAKKKACHF